MEMRVDGQRVRKLREAKLGTQEELADRCGTESAQTHEIDSDRSDFERDFPWTGVAA
jgi:transcriptional regulator with XRE-family HTH domain